MLIVIEGLDGSGKSTQVPLILPELRRRGIDGMKISFPDYDSESSALIKMYLSGALGADAAAVNAYAASSFYAVDRYASLKKVWGKYYAGGGLVLADRYTSSNAVHQAVKCPPGEQEGFLRWLDDFEHDKLGLPRADAVVYLDMPTEQAATLLRQREQRAGTKGDIHETDTAYLAACRETALRAARLLGWYRIDCVDAAGQLKRIGAIHQEIVTLVEPMLGQLGRKGAERTW